MHTAIHDFAGTSGHRRWARPSRLLSAAAAVLAAVACGLGATGPAGAATAAGPHRTAALPRASLTAVPASGVRPDQSFEVINLNSGKCLGTSAGQDNADAVQWTCNGAANQQWHWGNSYGGSLYYQLKNGNDGGNDQCLGISAGSAKEGADAVAWTCGGTSHPDQYWYAVDVTGCGTVLYNLNSSYVLGVAGNSKADGAHAVQWAYQGACGYNQSNNNQFWHD
jgi:hypothetical protein